MFDTLGGQRGVGQSMFDSFKPTIGPSPDEMEADPELVAVHEPLSMAVQLVPALLN